MATIPTVLYYLSIFLMIEADSRRLGTRGRMPDVGIRRHPVSEVRLSLHVAGRDRRVHGRGHVGVSRGVLGDGARGRLSFLRRETALTPRRLAQPSEPARQGVLGVCATTATAGIIVGVVTLTGLGLKIAGLIVALAGGHLFLTVVYSALAVWMLGLAVPVTASYIIAAVMVAPALVQAGVPDFAAHMFIFYYAVLSEVSPPTALSPFAAAAITGGNPFKTMMLTWKYTLPAFLVPFVFTLTPAGLGRAAAGDSAPVIAAADADGGGGHRGAGGGLRRLDSRSRVRPRTSASPGLPEACCATRPAGQTWLAWPLSGWCSSCTSAGVR